MKIIFKIFLILTFSLSFTLKLFNFPKMDSFSISLIISSDDPPTVLNILAGTQLFESKGQIRRLINQGAIKIDGQKAGSTEDEIKLNNSKGVVVKTGKKKLK